MTLWQTDNHSPDTALTRFTASHDTQLDQRLLEPDILLNIAHSQMLYEQDYLTADEKDDIHTALLTLHNDTPDITAFEDIHTAIEELVTQQTDAGTKLHTGRSRNDQIATDTLIWLRWQAVTTGQKTISVIDGLDGIGDNTVIPGHTHSRQAMPTTVENWAGSFAASLLDGLEQLQMVYEQCRACPLGSAAGFGTHLDIDRGRTAELLGFDTVQHNTLHGVQSRGQYSLAALQAIQSIGLTLSNLADALIDHTGPEGWMDLDTSMTTGSSIMPQKQNPDGLELIRARCTELLQQPGTVATIMQSGMTGYNRDIQQTKHIVMEAFTLLQDCLDMMTAHLQAIELDPDTAAEQLADSITAAAAANKLVENGLPFRKAYEKVKEEGNDHETEPKAAASSFPAEERDNSVDRWKGYADAETAWKQDLLQLAGTAGRQQ